MEAFSYNKLIFFFITPFIAKIDNLWYNKPVARVYSVGETQMNFQVGDLFYIELFDRKLKTENGMRQMQYEDILRETKTLTILDVKYSDFSEKDTESGLRVKTSVFKVQYSDGSVFYFPEKYLQSFIDQPRLYEKWTYYPINT